MISRHFLHAISILILPLCLMSLSCVSRKNTDKEAPHDPDPADMITINGKPFFMNGMNIAWMNFSRDLVVFNSKTFTRCVEEVAASGGNTLRWWLHTTGAATPIFDTENQRCIGIADQSIAAVKRGLDIASERGVGLMLCLWSFGMLDKGQGARIDRSMAMLTDDQALQAYIDNALIPLVESVRGHRANLGWEIFNEPEGMSRLFGWTSDRVSMEDIQRFVNRTAGAIHRADPEALVTNGSWNMRVLTDVDGMYNYYTDERLIEAGGDPDGCLDYYTVHFYPEHFDDRTNPFSKPKSYWELDKPLVIAEFPAAGLKDLGKGFKLRDTMSAQECYLFAIRNGYAGALGWTWTAHDGFGSTADAAPGMAAVKTAYPDYVTLPMSELP